MTKKAEEEIAQLKKEIIKTKLIGAPGMIMVGLGLYGVFAAKGDAFHPFLNDPTNCYGILIVGAVITIWENIKVKKLTKRHWELSKELYT